MTDRESTPTAAKCNTCGKPLTLREFRASRSGHFCDAHRPPAPTPTQSTTSRPTPRQPKRSSRGNVAFKVTWVYGADGPFSAPCTPEGREINIKKRKVTWCRQPECPCRQLFDDGNAAEYNRDLEYWPCYDSAIFDKWSFGGGVFHTKQRAGQEIPFKEFQLGKLAFFTTRRYDMEEAERIVIGCYRIEKAITDQDFDILVAAAGCFRLRVIDFDKAPRFWDYHQQASGPRWGTGLFRYLPDGEATALLEAIRPVSVEVK